MTSFHPCCHIGVVATPIFLYLFNENLRISYRQNLNFSTLLFNKTINCITLYINRDIIQGWGTDNSGNSRYYSVLNALALSINDFVNESTNNFSRQLFS